jgi:hypothetical protein
MPTSVRTRTWKDGRRRVIRSGPLTLTVNEIGVEEYDPAVRYFGPPSRFTIGVSGIVTSDAPGPLWVGAARLVRGSSPVPTPQTAPAPAFALLPPAGRYLSAGIPVAGDAAPGNPASLTLTVPYTRRLQLRRVRLSPKAGAVGPWQRFGSGPGAVRWRAKVVRERWPNRHLPLPTHTLEVEVEEAGPPAASGGDRRESVARHEPILIARAPWMLTSPASAWRDERSGHLVTRYTLSRKESWGDPHPAPVEFGIFPTLAPVPGVEYVRAVIDPIVLKRAA